MANPNIVNVSVIYGGTALASGTTSFASLIANAAASGKILKVNTFIAANVDGTTNGEIDAKIVRSATDFIIAKTIVVPADSSLVLISKDTAIYLNEGDDLQVKANATSTIDFLCSYEEIS